MQRPVGYQVEGYTRVVEQMDFDVFSEESILEARIERPHIIISVADVATYPTEIPPNPLCLGILRLAFYKGFYYFPGIS